MATARGFVVLEISKESGRIVHRDRDGKEIGELAAFQQRVHDWWAASRGDAAAALLADGKLSISGAETDAPVVEPYFDGEVAVSPNGRRAAFRTESSIVVRDVVPNGRRVEIPTRDVKEGPLWSLDGKTLVTITGGAGSRREDERTSCDAVLVCDPDADKPEWRVLYRSEAASLSCLCADMSNRRVAFVESSTGTVKVRLFDLEMGEIKVSHGMQDVHNLSFAPSGSLLLVFNRQEGGRGTMLFDMSTVEGRVLPRITDPEGREAELLTAATAGRDIWLAVWLAGKDLPEVVRVSPAP
jgi:hypothetical protein